MKERVKKEFIVTNARLLDVNEFMAYTNLGRNSVLRLGKEIGAIRKVGTRTLFDKVVIDRYFDSQAEEAAQYE